MKNASSREMGVLVVLLLLLALAASWGAPLPLRATSPENGRTLLLLCTAQQQRADLESLLGQVSDHRHERYRKFLTRHELHRRFAPSNDTRQRALRWLSGSTILRATPYRLVVSGAVNVTTAPPDTICGVRTSEERRTKTARRTHATPAPMDRPQGSPAYAVAAAQSFAAVYNAPDPASASPGSPGTHNVSVMVIEIDAPYLVSDAAAYARLTGTTADALSFVTFNQSSDAPSGLSFDEASLDVDMILSTSPLGTQLYYLGDNNLAVAWEIEWCMQILESGVTPDLVSLSWGETEIPGYAYQTQGYDCMHQLLLLGTTIVASSGDNGVYGINSCGATYEPQYPANDPYITGVGATAWPGVATATVASTPMCAQTSTIAQLGAMYNFTAGGYSASGAYFACITSLHSPGEIAVSRSAGGFFSGGGFSAQFSAPSWQQAALAAYLGTPGVPFPAASLWNASGRGLPDVSMYGSGSPVMINGTLSSFGGTSQSAPVLASLLVPLVAWSYANLGTPLGSINPLLYAMAASSPTTFQDVTVGNNNGTESSNGCALGGFTAAPGWDAVTGLGTPNLGNMLAWMAAHLVASGSSSGAGSGQSSSSSLLGASATSPSASSSSPLSDSFSSSSAPRPAPASAGWLETAFSLPWLPATVVAIAVVALCATVCIYATVATLAAKSARRAQEAANKQQQQTWPPLLTKGRRANILPRARSERVSSHRRMPWIASWD